MRYLSPLILEGMTFHTHLLKKEHTSVCQNISVEAEFEEFGTCKLGQELLVNALVSYLVTAFSWKNILRYPRTSFSLYSYSSTMSTAGVGGY